MTPLIIFQGTGSLGGLLFLWALGGIFALCGLSVWLELGLSIPFRRIPGRQEKTSVPRSGGEKNYVCTRMTMS